ncbi:secreted protein [Beggiatoa sp. PS]|nr:secreted protein [Beggiatoa sp. PS]
MQIILENDFDIKKLSITLFLLFIFLPHLSYAVPPYLSISVKENLSFYKDSCLQAAKTALNHSSFQITQDKIVGLYLRLLIKKISTNIKTKHW